MSILARNGWAKIWTETFRDRKIGKESLGPRAFRSCRGLVSFLIFLSANLSVNCPALFRSQCQDALVGPLLQQPDLIFQRRCVITHANSCKPLTGPLHDPPGPSFYQALQKIAI